MVVFLNKLAELFHDNIEKSYGVTDKPIEQILGHIMAFVPLILDSIFQNYSIICPYEKTRAYATLMLLSPFISVMLVALTLGAQFFGRKYSQGGLKAIIVKIFPGIMSMMFTAGITLGASFLKGDSFACIYLGAPPTPYEIDLRAFYKRDFLTLTATSRIIGWCVIWFTLLAMFIGVIIRYTFFKRTRIQLLSMKLQKIQIIETKRIIQKQISLVGKTIARKRIESALHQIEDKSNQALLLINELNNILDGELSNIKTKNNVKVDWELSESSEQKLI